MVDLVFRAWEGSEHGEGSWESEEGRENGVITFGNSHKTQNTWYIISGPDYPGENPEYQGKSGVFGFKPGVSGFPWTPRNEFEFESISLPDL